MCGSEIVDKEIVQESAYPEPFEVLYDLEKQSDENLSKLTFGKLTKEDLKVLEGTNLVTDVNKTEGYFILAPGYTGFYDLTRSDKNFIPLALPLAPTQEWLEAIKKVFNVKEATIQYGAVLDAN